jgi:serine/threonine-protein kinase
MSAQRWGLPVRLMDEHRSSERFGRYEILAELGRGAMGVVYRARDPKINRVVAVKTVSLAGQPPDAELEYRERFVHEAEAAGRLSHPGIVTIYDVGEEPETRAPYIVMEFVNGPSLEKLLSDHDHTLPMEHALQLTLELAEALDCAHGQGVVHRDLKPANILITEDGHAKIADFGIAKLNLANLTLGRRTLGTPAYMSPEQLNGDEVDGRSDLFSLGVILYTVLTGYRPFQGNSAMTVSFKVVNKEPVPASVLDTDLPPGLDYIISRAMAKDPAQRYQRGMEMVLDIQELREGREPWSKTKQPGSLGAANVAQASNGVPKPRATSPRLKIQPNSRKATHSPRRHPMEHVVERMHRLPFAAALLLAGILVFGLQVRHFYSAKKAGAGAPLENKLAQPLPVTSEALTPKQVTVATGAPGTTAPGVATTVNTPGSTPVAKTLALKKIAHKTAAAKPANLPEKIAGARSPTPAIGPAISPALLDIQVDHKFAEAHLTIWVDDQMTYTHLLEGADKKRLVVFHTVQAHEFHAMQVPLGKHQLRVRVESPVDSYDQSGVVAGEFSTAKEQVLRINFGKRGEMQLSLQ